MAIEPNRGDTTVGDVVAQTGFKDAWKNFFTKLKTDQNLQQALLNFGANVTNPQFGDNQTQAITSSVAQAVGGYREAVKTQAAQAVAAQMAGEKHRAGLAKTASEIEASSADTKLKGAQLPKVEAEAARTAGGVDLDASQAELNRARAREAEANAKAGGKNAQKPSHLQILAQALKAKGYAEDDDSAYLLATKMDKDPSMQKIVSDFIANQGFLYGDQLPAAVDQLTNLAQGASSLQTGQSQLAPGAAAPTPTPQVDLDALRSMANAYLATQGQKPISEAKLLELSRNPQQIQQLINLSQPNTGTP
jgi:hypothetical protein